MQKCRFQKHVTDILLEKLVFEFNDAIVTSWFEMSPSLCVSVCILTFIRALSPCHVRACAPHSVCALQVQGTWYVLAIICSSWNRVPLCDQVQLQGNGSLLHETWTSLDLLSDPHYRHGAVYITDLAVIQPGCWRDLRPERGN